MLNKSQATKVLKDADKKVSNVLGKTDSALQQQYKVIREDISKLKSDLTEGYDIAKNIVEKNGFFKKILKSI